MFEFIAKAVYINLEKRKDRKEEIEKELKKYFPEDKILRFNAIEDTRKGIGCSLSHIGVLEMAIENKWDNCLIVEDDLIWSNFDIGYEILEKLIKIKYDVIMLSSTYSDIDNKNYRLKKGQTTLAYLVSKSYYEILLENIKEGLKNLIETKIYHNFALDVYFKKLQEKDNWYGIFPNLCVQRPTYSDIEKNFRNYIAEGCYANHNTNFQMQISQIYLNEYDDTPPKSLQILIKKIKEICKNRNWVYKLYDKISLREFIKDNYDIEILNTYDSLYSFAYKSDIGRYCILNKLGGWYFDISMDIVNIPHMDKIIHCLSFRDILKIGAPWACCTGVMYSKPNNPVLQKAIKYIVENCKNEFYGHTALSPTGPEVVGKAFCDFGSHQGFLFGELKNLTPGNQVVNNAVIDYTGNIIAFTKKCRGGDLTPFSNNKGFNNYGELWQNGLIYDGDKNFGGYIPKNKSKNNFEKIGILSVIDKGENLEKILLFSNTIDIVLIILNNSPQILEKLNGKNNIIKLFPNMIFEDYTEYYKTGMKILFEDKNCELVINFKDFPFDIIAENYIEKVKNIFKKYNPELFSGYTSKIYPSYLASLDKNVKLLAQCEDYNIVVPSSTFRNLNQEEIKDNFFYRMIEKIGRIHCPSDENFIDINIDIPKIIYTFQNKNVDKWKELNQFYDIINFENEQEILKFLEVSIPNNNIEFLKNLIVFLKGGAFVDKDLAPIDLSKIIEDRIPFYTDLNKKFVASVKNHPFLRFYLNVLNIKIENVDLYSIIKGTLELNSLQVGNYETFKIIPS